MAAVTLADIYEPLTFNSAIDEAAVELNAFVRSGVLVENPQLTAQAQVGGTIGELPFYKDLDKTDEPDYTNDDDTDESSYGSISTGKMIWRAAAMHKAWSTMDFAREFGLSDPLAAITRRIGGWWAYQKQRRLIYSALGVMADNDADDSDDMIKNIYSDVVAGSITDDNRPSAEAILDARQTLGDHFGEISAIAVHSVTFNYLNKLNLIDYIPDSQGRIDFPSYLGMAVVVDDSMPVISGSNSPAYISILFGMGAFDHGTGSPMVPSEIERKASSGNGGGQDILHTRQTSIIHPYGMSFISGSVADESATLAELALAANWNRVVVNRKNVRIAFLKHNV